MDVMSEIELKLKKLIKKVWVSFISSMLGLFFVAIIGYAYTIKRTDERSVTNEKNIKTLREVIVKKQDNEKAHLLLQNEITDNKDNISKLDDKFDKKVEKILDGQDNIKSLILKLHAK